MDELAQTNLPSGLYVVATPIGNLEDISFRAVKTLENVDCVAAEDTRHTSRLLNHYRIRTPLVSYHEHNERQRAPELVEKVRAGLSVALVSDAGTPAVSDPGFRLVRAAVENGLAVYPIPGVSAAVTALSASGLPSDGFVFIGFLPKKRGKRLDMLHALAAEPRTLVFYESPRRVAALLEAVKSIMGERPAVLGREMTKLHEEFLRGSVTDVQAELAGRPEIRGECTLLIGGATDRKVVSDAELEDLLQEALARPGSSVSSVSKALAKHCGLPRRSIYEKALAISKTMDDRKRD